MISNDQLSFLSVEGPGLLRIMFNFFRFLGKCDLTVVACENFYLSSICLISFSFLLKTVL